MLEQSIVIADVGTVQASVHQCSYACAARPGCEHTNANAKTPVHLAPRAQAQYNAEELLRKREEISDLIRQNLTKRASEFHLILDGTLISTFISYVLVEL